MKKLKTSILLLGICLGANAIAQNRPIESISLINNINSMNDLYSGTVNVSIPLFEIPVGNLKLYNEISYTSSPFDPNIDESKYGLNWNSNSFGQITREIRQDILLKENIQEAASQGLGALIHDETRQRKTTDCIMQKQSFGQRLLPSKKQILFQPNNPIIKDGYNPNKYYFDFFGYKGYFVYDNLGNVLVNSDNANLKVLGPGSLSSSCYSVINPIDFQNTSVTEIRMIDDKGNTFYFGGSYDALDVSYAQYGYSIPTLPNGEASSRANYIISWNLKKVELSNGDIILATYKEGNPDIYNNFLQVSLTSGTYPTELPSKAQQNQANIETSESYIRVHSNLINSYSTQDLIQTKKSILQKIEVVGKDINIGYNYFKDSNSLIHLQGITLNYFGKSENIILNQTPLGGQYYRYFLQSIIKNNEKYVFEYYKTDGLPSKGLVTSTNGYGYWKGINGNSEDFEATLLKKITYPTKGSVIFNYEKSNASKTTGLQDISDSTYAPIPRLLSKVEDSNAGQYITNYKYKLDNGKSSGIAMSAPDQYTYILINNKKISAEPYYYYYSQVQEITENKGMVEYFFTDQITNPSVKNRKHIVGNQIITPSSSMPPNPPKRGQLLKKKIYDSDNKLIREYQYEYKSFLRPESELVDLDSSDCNACKVSDQNYYVYQDILSKNLQTQAPESSTTEYIAVIPYLLKKEKVIEYLNGQQITSETNIKYRESNIFWHPYPEQTEITTNLGTNIKKYLYAYELKQSGCRSGCPLDETIVGGQNPMYETMIRANIWFPIIEIVKNENNKYSLKESLFHTWPIIPKKIRYSSLNTDLDFTNYKISIDKTIDQINYDLIDNKGNYIQTTDKSGIPTVTIYGYKQSLPILKITGLTYVQFMQILGQPASPTDYLSLSIVTKSNADVDAASEQLLINELNILRNNPLLKDYPITTYTHDPLIGVTSITPPSGIGEYYIYDSANRLEKVVDSNNNILKDYKYNYKQ